MLSICFILFISILTPSYGQTMSFCPPYSASMTNYAMMNYVTCSIYACPGDISTISTHAPGDCTGDTLLRLIDPSTGVQLAFNNDFKNDCAEITSYAFTASCRYYELRQGCNYMDSCSGKVYYTGLTAPPSGPTAAPSTTIEEVFGERRLRS